MITEANPAKIKELVEEVYNLKEEKRQNDIQINDLKEVSVRLQEKIDEKENHVLEYLQENNLKELEYSDIESVADGLVAAKFSRTGFSYGDEKDLISYLKKNNLDNYLKTKTTESLDKVKLKKDLKLNESLATMLGDRVGDTLTEYVVITTKPNYKTMLEHIDETTKK